MEQHLLDTNKGKRFYLAFLQLNMASGNEPLKNHPGVDVIKPFSSLPMLKNFFCPQFTDLRNKLKCLSQEAAFPAWSIVCDQCQEPTLEWSTLKVIQ